MSNINPIRAKRLAKGLTQSDLAKLLDADQATVAKWERGRRIPRPQSLRKLRRLLGLTDKEVVEIQLWSPARPKRPEAPETQSAA